MSDPKYPRGKFQPEPRLTPQRRKTLLDQIGELPSLLRKALAGLTDKQLDTPYREGGWTVRQLVHHVADSHVNAYVRFKLGLTEEQPTIKPYNQDAWAGLSDSREPVEVSLRILEAVHERWVKLLRHLDERVFDRTINHPESGVMNLNALLSLYAWHGRHHTAHITTLRERESW